MLLREVADAAQSRLRYPLGGFGLGSTFQRLPFQCSISVWQFGPPLPQLDGWMMPTAQMLSVQVCMTPSKLASPSGVLPGTIVQRLPSQCRTSALDRPLTSSDPTAHALSGETTVTPRR